MEKVLFVGAHPDDETLGAGACIAKHIAENDEVKVLILGEGPTSRDGESASKIAASQLETALGILGVKDFEVLGLADQKFDTLPSLDVNKKVSEAIHRFGPDIVYTHHYSDLNKDHRITAEAVLVACRAKPGNTIDEVLFWETLSSTEWSAEKNFKAHVYVGVSDQIELKVKAFGSYMSEKEGFPHPRSEEVIRAMASKRGSEVGLKAAEAFEVHRIIRP